MIEAGKAEKPPKETETTRQKPQTHKRNMHHTTNKRTAAATLYAARAVKRGAMYPSPRTPGSRSSPPKDAPASMPEQSSEP